MTKIAAVLLIALTVFVAACEYQAPPGGPDGYCWRVKQTRFEAEQDLVLYTNVEPTRRSGSVTVRDAWFTFANNGRVPDRYDRYADEVMLSDVLGGVTIEQRCDPSE